MKLLLYHKTEWNQRPVSIKLLNYEAASSPCANSEILPAALLRLEKFSQNSVLSNKHIDKAFMLPSLMKFGLSRAGLFHCISLMF